MVQKLQYSTRPLCQYIQTNTVPNLCAIVAYNCEIIQFPIGMNIDYIFPTVQAGMPMTVKGEGRVNNPPFAGPAAAL